MNRRSVPICLFLAALFCHAPVLRAQDRRVRLAQAVERLRESLVAQRRDFHMYPELSNREERTSRVIAQKLRALGLDEVRTGVSRHGIVALLKGARPGPVVALRADMDALPIEETLDVPYRSRHPGVKHACGHDVHMTVALGVAEVLSAMRGELPGAVKFLFQPAEEGAPEGEDSGAHRMIREGALENPRPAAIFAFHVDPMLEVGKVGYVAGPALASSDTFFIRIVGRRAHAAMPHQGVDPVVVAAECILALQSIRSRRMDPVEPLVLSVTTVHGGNRSNIIADEVRLEGTLRTHNEAVRERAIGLVREIVAGVAAAHGAQAEVRWSARSIPPTINDPGLVEASLPSLRRTLGHAGVVPARPSMAAEDFAFYQKQIPGVMFWLGVGNPARGIRAALHTPEFDADEESLVVGVKVMSNLLLDYMESHATGR
ncbi:MAG: M20 family metallopeptidase [Bryobacterales bacterium]|nr:M20 family metallopeptidase [Bryobacteraceae bacterium]MDW8130499.1 M20 family metallopeptidase [Bryobacterales bacterium]